MNLEEQLGHQLAQDAERLHPPIHAIVAEADRQGRKLRFRRRLQIAGAAAAVAALATTGTALGLQPGHDKGAVVQAAAPAADPTAVGITPGAGGTPTTPATGSVPLNSDAMLKIVSGLLPAGTKLTNYKPGQPDWAKLPGATSISVEADSGQGPVWITLSERDHVTGLPATDCNSDGKAGDSRPDCTPGTMAFDKSTIQAMGDWDATADCSPVQLDIKHTDDLAVRLTLRTCVQRGGALVPSHKSAQTLAPWSNHVTSSHNWMAKVPAELAAQGAELAKTIPVVN
ncbi:hypothetical protein [Kitasatospora sp. McL0602]|uniref:hypothetical protein n=1 Tax=Kitasatospora sp. McL0602 TaxID=3439530 RepID=UPI003F8A52C0